MKKIQLIQRSSYLILIRLIVELKTFILVFSTKKIGSNTLLGSIKKPFPSRISVGSQFDKLYQYQQKGIRYFASFVDQATPGFELGKKDLQSPALPLGHAAKATQNSRQSNTK